MSEFVLDLWADLKARRLWPVAALLVVALLAVPAVFLKRSEAPPPAPVPAPAADSALPAVALSSAGLAGSSPLDAFIAKNPFRPRNDAFRAQGTPPPGTPGAPGAGDGAASAGRGPGMATVDPGAPLSSGAGAGLPSPRSSGGTATPIPNQGDAVAPDGGAPSSGGGGGGGGTTVTRYTYTADVEVGVRGRERKIDGIDRLALLPSARQPLLVYLGVDTLGKTAVFLVDSSLSQTGEGSCKPNRSTCAFVYLKVDSDQNEHFFAADDGTEYGLKLLDIDRRQIGRTKAAARARQPLAKGAGSRRWSFGFPLFLDERRSR